ncbi:hypothetical protein Pyn_23399 [Prunus yedoensis var. nudiflora]|uniref:Uncharacterized protein n=1 Tax=Prunus yedoensis var. nudiflora TaxID=2094558 RepID=A0A314Z4Q3_PRUYE|nr:hypothetical protein Pyn_23399 [Prunus yedoensis var. nudiflora]
MNQIKQDDEGHGHQSVDLELHDEDENVDAQGCRDDDGGMGWVGEVSCSGWGRGMDLGRRGD